MVSVVIRSGHRKASRANAARGALEASSGRMTPLATRPINLVREPSQCNSPWPESLRQPACRKAKPIGYYVCRTSDTPTWCRYTSSQPFQPLNSKSSTVTSEIQMPQGNTPRAAPDGYGLYKLL